MRVGRSKLSSAMGGTEMPEPTAMPLNAAKESLLRRMEQEAIELPEFDMMLNLDLTATLGLVGNLQIAFRHPGNTGPSAQMMRDLVRHIIEGMRERGYVATAEACMLGAD